MKPDWEEKHLQELFLELRREDEQRAPSFDRAWQSALARTGKTRASFFHLAAAAAVVLLGLAGASFPGRQWSREPVPARDSRWDIVLHDSRSGGLPWQSAVLLCEWQSPTDFLLETSGERFWKAGSPSGESLSNFDLIRPATKKTEKRNGATL